MENVLITGGTGMIGKALVEALLKKGYRVTILTRQKQTGKKEYNLSFSTWDINKQLIDDEAISSANFIIHLAGAGIGDRRWSTARKKEIVESRVNSSRLIAASLERIPNKVQAVISASAIGYYGIDKKIPSDHAFTEEDSPAPGFLGETCQQWEAAISPVSKQTRLVIFRQGLVLDPAGGAMKEFLKPLRMHIATILGSGQQVVSWIHRDDLVNMYIAAIENSSISGIYNAVSPEPVTNQHLVKSIAQARCRSFLNIRVPSILLRAMLGEISIEVLKSTTVSARKILETGFHFSFPGVNSACRDLLHSKFTVKAT